MKNLSFYLLSSEAAICFHFLACYQKSNGRNIHFDLNFKTLNVDHLQTLIW